MGGQLLLLGRRCAVEWLTGYFTTDRQPAQWARYEEQGTCWPCNLPDFKSWRKVSCAALRPVRAFRASPRWPDQKRKCLWVWGESAAAAAPAAPAHEPTTVTGEILAPGVAARLNAWWESGGKVLIVTDGSLKHIRAAGGRELVPRGGAGWVFGLAPAEFKDEAPNTDQSAVEWLPGVGCSIPLSRWMNPSSFICETAAAAGALACIATACAEGVLFPGSLTLYSDNKGMIQVLQGLDGRKHNAWRKTVGVG